MTNSLIKKTTSCRTLLQVLPSQLKSITEYLKFKVALKTFLIEQCFFFYSIDDFWEHFKAINLAQIKMFLPIVNCISKINLPTPKT